MAPPILREPLERVEADRPCPLSGTREAVVVSARARDGTPLRTVINCASGLVYVDPIPMPDVRSFYAEEYRREYKASARPRTRRVLRAGAASLARLARVLPHLVRAQQGAAAPPRTLDIGASSGEFVLLMQELGCRAVGCEPNVEFSRFAREELGANVLTGMFDDVALEPGLFDLVTLFHVAEHMEDPRGTLVRLCALLRPGGLVVVEVPNILTANMGFLRKWHRGHLFGFSRATLASLAEACGIEVLELGATGDDHNVWLVGRTRAGGGAGAGAGAAATGTERAGPAHFQAAVRALQANARTPQWLRARVFRAAGMRLARTLREARASARTDARGALRRLYREAIAGPLGRDATALQLRP
jgi:2-polyprenyl-3-methyl-5-hydroxy-6-metoxy-1,4-benzoquinol methylase